MYRVKITDSCYTYPFSDCVYFVHRTATGRGKRGSKKGPHRESRERKDERIIYSNNMATAIDDRQELLEQFQAVSESFCLSRDELWTIVLQDIRYYGFLLMLYYHAHPSFLSIAGFISMLSWKPTLVKTTPGVAALQSVYSFFTSSFREISNVCNVCWESYLIYNYAYLRNEKAISLFRIYWYDVFNVFFLFF